MGTPALVAGERHKASTQHNLPGIERAILECLLWSPVARLRDESKPPFGTEVCGIESGDAGRARSRGGPQGERGRGCYIHLGLQFSEFF